MPPWRPCLQGGRGKPDPEDWSPGHPKAIMTTVQVGAFLGAEPPLKRSVPLMIAEFLYNPAMRHAVASRLTRGQTHDVKRWNRPAHTQRSLKPPQTIQPRHERTEFVESKDNTSVMSAFGTSFHVHRQDSSVVALQDYGIVFFSDFGETTDKNIEAIFFLRVIFGFSSS
ncbi:hypothetical protein JG687_00015946 [Phytophthora cactorum]|uniref:Uncharacterized protein n=1 Tax=Phytophthora cactorum TaxID=29920 RepID=A0A8T1TTC6_9STRA|nr:hypothetical protein JG687_00015946 [Phytophthora cactorum]